MSRSHFVAVIAAVVALGSAVGVRDAAAAVLEGKERAFAGARFALEIGGAVAGWINSVEGGGAVGEVVATQGGSGGESKKHIGGIRFEDIDMTIATPIPAPVLAWMKETLAGSFRRQSGAVVTTDYEGRVIERLEFSDALLTEMVFPPLDAASREIATLSLRLQPERTRLRKVSGGPRIELPRPAKPAMLSMFRLALDRLPTARVAAVEGLSVKVKLNAADTGAGRTPLVDPVRVEVSNLVLRIALNDADPYTEWLEDFVVNGNSSDDRERTGTLDLLAADARPVLSLTLHHVGIIRTIRDRRDSNSENTTRAKVELYCERISLSN